MGLDIDQWDHGALMVNQRFARVLKHIGLDSAAAVWRVRGEPVKQLICERGTERFNLIMENGETFPVYLKRYRPVGWRETIKRWLSFKPSVYDAINEWKALVTFHDLSIPSLVPIAAGRLDRRSFSLTLGLVDHIRLADLQESGKIEFRIRRRLVDSIAELAARMHNAGFAHQDFYLAHFFIDDSLSSPVKVIDLQRVFKWRGSGWRWRIKDLAQLYFSAGPGASRTDVLFFWRSYCRRTGIYRRDRQLMARINAKANRISRHHNKRFSSV